MREHYLLASIGKSPRKTEYELGKISSTTHFSSTALVRMMENKPSRIYLLLTETARKGSFDVFDSEIDTEVEVIPIPNGINDEEVEEILYKILNSIPENCELTIDITQGLRHFPFLLFTSAMYLQSFKNIRIRNVYYGMFEADTDRKPFVDLNVIFELAEWFHAVRCFSEERRARPLIEIIRSGYGKEPDASQNISKLIDSLMKQIELFDKYYGSGLPLGVGDATKSFCNQLEKQGDNIILNNGQGPIPMAKELLAYTSGSLKPFMLPKELKTWGKWKKGFPLNFEEIHRQEGLIDDFLDSGHYVNAVRMIREWMINRCILSCEDRNASWLDERVRRPIERQLGSIKWQLNRKILQEDKVELAMSWDTITQFRNIVAHNEMTEDNYNINERIDTICEKWAFLKSKIADDGFWNPFTGGGKGKLLITPLGFSKGLLYSALSLIRPDKCFIVTSRDAGNAIPEIIATAGYEGDVLPPYVLDDPFTGYGEISRILGEIVTDHAATILGSDEVIVNLTGGTTTLQILAEEISNKAWQMGKDPRKVVIIDKRSFADQKENPYVVGEMIEYKEIISHNEEEGE